MAVAWRDQEGVTGADALPPAFHFQLEHAFQPDQHLEVVVRVAAGRGAVAAQREMFGQGHGA